MRLPTAVAGIGALSACGVVRLPPGQVCDEVGFAISRRTWQCTGDEALAAERWDAFQDDATCYDVDAEVDEADNYLACATAIEAMSCEEVEAAGDDLSAWLAASPVCEWLVVLEDG